MSIARLVSEVPWNLLDTARNIMGLMAQCREQCRRARRTATISPTLDPTPSLLALPEPLPQLNPFPLLTLPSILLSNWPDEPTPSLVAREPPPFPQGNDIIRTLCRLNEAGAGLTDEVLLEWELDILHSLEDWRWLWSLEPAITPSLSQTLNYPLPLWYGASNSNLPNMFTPNAQSTYAPLAKLPL